MSLIESYAAQDVRPELQPLKDNLVAMTKTYAEAVEKVTSIKDQAYNDLMARRLVEMAGNIVMGYLLLLDANRTESFTKSAEVYNKMAQAEVAKHSNFINNFVPDQIEAYKE